MLIDTHCHLDDARYNDDLDEVLANAKLQGVEKFIIPGADPQTLQRAVDLAEMYENIRLLDIPNVSLLVNAGWIISDFPNLKMK